MASFNRVILMGNLTRDPELRNLPSGTALVDFGLAVNRRYKNSQGEQQEEVTFVDCTAFGRPAEVINQYCSKGKPLLIEGRLKLDQWQDQNGNNRSKHKVIVENFQFISDSGGGQRQANNAPSQSAAPAGNSAPDAQEPPYESIAEDDIPF